MRWLGSSRYTATGADQVGLQVVAYLQVIMLQQVDSLTSHALTNSIAPAESMTAIVLILLAAAVKAMRNWSKRLSQSRLTLQTDSFDLTLQTKQPSSLQELPPHEQQGVDENGNSNDDDGRIPSTSERPQFWSVCRTWFSWKYVFWSSENAKEKTNDCIPTQIQE